MATVFEVVLLGGSSSLEYELDYNSRKTNSFHKGSSSCCYPGRM